MARTVRLPLLLAATAAALVLPLLLSTPPAAAHPCSLNRLKATGHGVDPSNWTRGDGGPAGVINNRTGVLNKHGDLVCSFSNGDCWCQPGRKCFCEQQHGNCYCGQASECQCSMRTGNCFCNQTDKCHCKMKGITTQCQCQDSCSCWCGDLFSACLGGNASIMTCMDISDPFSGTCNCENADRCLFNSFGFGNNLDNRTYARGMNPRGPIIIDNRTQPQNLSSIGLRLDARLWLLVPSVALVVWLA